MLPRTWRMWGILFSTICLWQNMALPRSSYRRRFMNVYEVSALGLAGEIVRPIHARLQGQAGVTLPYIGGYESAEVENVRINGLVFAKSVRSTVGSSHDEQRNSQTAFASTVIEHLNICDVVTADRVVARLSGFREQEDTETRYSLSGTRFENLRIAGQLVEARLDIDTFNERSTYSRLERLPAENQEYLHGGRLDQQISDPAIWADYPALKALYQEQVERQHKSNRDLPAWYSLANHIQVEAAGLRSFGSIILVPDFGVIHFAELFITQRQRRLSMLRLELGSPIEGKIVAATCAVGDNTDSTGPR